MKSPPASRGRHSLALLHPALLIALLLLALCAPRANATLISDGTTFVRLDRGFLKRLQANGIQITPTGLATGHGPGLEVPIGGGQLMADGIGVVSLEGGLRFGSPGKALTLRSLGLDTRHRLLRAARGKGGLDLATLPSRSSRRDGFAIRIAVPSMRLGGAFAALLDRRFGLDHVFRPGQPFGRLSVDATLQSVKALRGTVDLTFDPEFAAKLATLGATVAPFESTRQLGPSQFSLPDIHGALGSDLAAGTLYAEDGLRFFPGAQAGGSELDFAQVSVDLGSDLVSARFRLDLPTKIEVGPLAKVDFSTAHVTPSGEDIAVAPQPAQLSDFAAHWLNAALVASSDAGIHFVAGEPFASIGLGVSPG